MARVPQHVVEAKRLKEKFSGKIGFILVLQTDKGDEPFELIAPLNVAMDLLTDLAFQTGTELPKKK